MGTTQSLPAQKSRGAHCEESNDYFRRFQWNAYWIWDPCEDEENYTKWYVLHAEANAITKVASSTASARGATLYITMSPCKECSKLIHQVGIKKLIYINEYKDRSGLDFLIKAGVEVVQMDIDWNEKTSFYG